MEPILVWAFDKAPEEYKALSTNGGDEDWIAVLPIGYKDTPYWIESGPFGYCGVDEYELRGQKVFIGCHS